jgi:hypothetical protein
MSNRIISYPPKWFTFPKQPKRQNQSRKPLNPNSNAYPSPFPSSFSDFNLLTSNLIRSIPALQIRHPTGLCSGHRPREIRNLVSIAHGVIVELDATSIRDRVECVS